MIVLDHSPQAWFLLQHEGALYLDVNCNHGAFGYSVLIAMNDAEVSAYQAKDRSFLDHLASEIHRTAPGARDSKSPYRERMLHGDLDRLVSIAIADWRGRNTGT